MLHVYKGFCRNTKKELPRGIVRDIHPRITMDTINSYYNPDRNLAEHPRDNVPAVCHVLQFRMFMNTQKRSCLLLFGRRHGKL